MPEFYYNESSYKADLINFKATGLVDGHTITNGEVTFADIINYNVAGYDISKQTNSISGFEIKNSASESVLTSNYNIVFEGTVFVKKAQLKVVGHKLGENDLPENKVYVPEEIIPQTATKKVNEW